MRYKLTFLGGVAVGYVLGARAGRARYEQISDLASRVAATDAAQKARETAMEQATHLADVAKSTVGDKVANVGDKVAAVVVDGRHKIEEALGDKLPERLRTHDEDDPTAADVDGVPSPRTPTVTTTNGSGSAV